MTADNAIQTEIRQFIVETFLFGDESDPFSDSDSFMQKGIIDSTGVLELTSFLEERFEITVDDEEMKPENLDSIENLVKYIEQKKA